MILPKIRTESVFKATDNSHHSSRKDAQLHECGLEIRRVLIDQGFPDNDGKVKAMAMQIAKNYPAFAGVLDAIRRVRRS